MGAASNFNALTKYFTYSAPAIGVALFHVIATLLREKNFFGSTRSEADDAARYLTVHSPGQTLLGKVFPILRNPVMMASVFGFFSLLYGYVVGISGAKGSFVFGIPSFATGSIAGQGVRSLGLAVEPAVSSETLLFNFFLLMGHTAVFYYVLRKLSFSHLSSIFISKAVAVITVALEFMQYHSYQYPGNEGSQFSVFILGLITNTEMALTHSIIPSYLFHGSGNFFYVAAKESILTETQMFGVAAGGMILCALGVVSVYLLYSNKNRAARRDKKQGCRDRWAVTSLELSTRSVSISATRFSSSWLEYCLEQQAACISGCSIRCLMSGSTTGLISRRITLRMGRLCLPGGRLRMLRMPWFNGCRSTDTV